MIIYGLLRYMNVNMIPTEQTDSKAFHYIPEKLNDMAYHKNVTVA